MPAQSEINKIMPADHLSQFKQSLQGLIGLPCWNVQAGAVGSMASLHIGRKIPLKQALPYPNTRLTPDEHKFRGEYILYIEDCPWRIDAEAHVLTSWTDSITTITQTMHSLIGKTIATVEITDPGLDLTLIFQDKTALRIFPDQSDPDEGDNYSLSLEDKTFIIGAKGTLNVETL